MNHDRSHDLFSRAQALLPCGVNSPVRAFKSVGGEPFFVERADGPCLYDVDGNRYIDYVGSWGPMIVGHNHPEVRAAVERAIGNGLSYGAPCAAEVTMAERIIRLAQSKSKLITTPYTYTDIGVRAPNSSKARELLGYNPKFDMDRALVPTIDWYRRHLHDFKTWM